MHITRTSPWEIALKTKTADVLIGQEVTIGSVVITGPGEYDVASISIQGMPSQDQTIFVMQVEDMRLCIVPKHPTELSSTVLEQIGSVDIAIVPLTKEDPASQTTALLNALEPQLALIVGDGDASQIKSSADVSVDGIKMTKALLPQDDRQIMVLAVK